MSASLEQSALVFSESVAAEARRKNVWFRLSQREVEVVHWAVPPVWIASSSSQLQQEVCGIAITVSLWITFLLVMTGELEKLLAEVALFWCHLMPK